MQSFECTACKGEDVHCNELQAQWRCAHYPFCECAMLSWERCSDLAAAHFTQSRAVCLASHKTTQPTSHNPSKTKSCATYQRGHFRRNPQVNLSVIIHSSTTHSPLEVAPPHPHTSTPTHPSPPTHPSKPAHPHTHPPSTQQYDTGRHPHPPTSTP